MGIVISVVFESHTSPCCQLPTTHHGLPVLGTNLQIFSFTGIPNIPEEPLAWYPFLNTVSHVADRLLLFGWKPLVHRKEVHRLKKPPPTVFMNAVPDVNPKDFKVAIVGGGICGIACAVALQRVGIQVDVYEAAPKFGEVGAGVGIGPNAVRALEKIGIWDEILKRSKNVKPSPRTFRFVSGFGEHEEIYDYPAADGDVGVGFHRAAFLDALTSLLDSARIHFNKRCVDVFPNSSDPTRMHIAYADGTSAESDVVLGADGIKSTVRSYIVDTSEMKGENDGQRTRCAFTNTSAYRGLVPWVRLKDDGVKTDLSLRPVCFTGQGQHIITFPIRGEIINTVAFICDRTIPTGHRILPPDQPWVTQSTTAELLSEFDGYGPDVRKLLECLEDPSVWSIHAVDPPLERYHRGQVALLGDAAHGMLPHLGAGAGQGVEDVYVLMLVLGHPSTTRNTIQRSLEVYDEVRRVRGNNILRASARAGDIYDGHGPSGATVEGIRSDSFGIWEPVWSHDLDADASRVESLLGSE